MLSFEISLWEFVDGFRCPSGIYHFACVLNSLIYTKHSCLFCIRNPKKGDKSSSEAG